MKKLLTLALLFGSIGMVGCHRPIKTLGEFLDLAIFASEGQAYFCPKYEGGCDHREKVKLGDVTVVKEGAENGHDRVVLKYWGTTKTKIKTPNNHCGKSVDTACPPIISWHYTEEWKYFGFVLSEDTVDEFDDLHGKDLTHAVLRGIHRGIHKFGWLRYEPGEDEFFWENRETRLWGVFSENTAALKDLELMGARVEDHNANQLGEKLAAQYGLSEERGQEVAKTISVYNKLITKRALTPSEKDQFSNSLLGVDYKTAERGVMSGDADEFDSLMERAAETNGTSPEAVSAIIKDMVL